MKKRRDSLLIAAAEFTQLCSSIETQVNVATGDGKQSVEGATALWDTGATSCFVSRRLIKQLGLKKIGEMDVRYADDQMATKHVYLVRLTFPTADRDIHVYAAETGDESQDFIIGMNVIRNGTFLLEPIGDGGVRFTFSV